MKKGKRRCPRCNTIVIKEAVIMDADGVEYYEIKCYKCPFVNKRKITRK